MGDVSSTGCDSNRANSVNNDLFRSTVFYHSLHFCVSDFAECCAVCDHPKDQYIGALWQAENICGIGCGKYDDCAAMILIILKLKRFIENRIK